MGKADIGEKGRMKKGNLGRRWPTTSADNSTTSLHAANLGRSAAKQRASNPSNTLLQFFSGRDCAVEDLSSIRSKVSPSYPMSKVSTTPINS